MIDETKGKEEEEEEKNPKRLVFQKTSMELNNIRTLNFTHHINFFYS